MRRGTPSLCACSDSIAVPTRSAVPTSSRTPVSPNSLRNRSEGDAGTKLGCVATVGYLMAPAMEKMGRYMAMRKPPTTAPRNTIMTGSIKEVSAATAASTSSS